MLVFTTHDAGIYDSCWYLRSMLMFTTHAGITLHADIYCACWYLRRMLVFTIHAGIYGTCWYLEFMLVFTIHAGNYDSSPSVLNSCTTASTIASSNELAMMQSL